MQKHFFLIIRWVNIRHRNRTHRPTGHCERTHLRINFKPYVTTLLQWISTCGHRQFRPPTQLYGLSCRQERCYLETPSIKCSKLLRKSIFWPLALPFLLPVKMYHIKYQSYYMLCMRNAATRISKPYLIPSIFAVQKTTTRWLAQLCSIWIEPK